MSSLTATPTRFIGLDLHKHYLIALAVNPTGEQVGGPWRVTLDHLDAWARQHLTRLDAVAVEITTNTYTVYDALVPLVHSVTVVHPPHVALITRVPVKTLFDYLEDNYTLDEFLECFPSVTREVACRALERSESALLERAAA